MRRNPVIEQLWHRGEFIGLDRADTRVTVDRTWQMRTGTTGGTAMAPRRQPGRYFQDYAGTQDEEDLPTQLIRKVHKSASLDSDCAQLTITCWNADPDGSPNKPAQGSLSQRRGFPTLTGLRLTASGEARWGASAGGELEPTEWSTVRTYDQAHSYGMIAQGNMIRTYQGYGGFHAVDGRVLYKTRLDALADGNLVPTGIWIIDDVDYDDEGNIEITCRDVVSILVDQIWYPSMVPLGCYPTMFYSKTWNMQAGNGPRGQVPSSTNYRDLTDIVRLALIWGGFWLKGAPNSADGRWPAIFGGLENTGIDSPSVIAADTFDKKPFIDVIKTIRDIVGYTTMADQEGGFRFQCADESTEILTKRGWLTHQELKVGDEALSVDPATTLSVWRPVTNISRTEVVDEPLVSIEAQGHSSLTTSNHRWWVPAQRRGRAGRWVTSDSFTWEDRIPRAVDRGDAPIEAVHSDEMVELVAWWVTEGSWKGAGAAPGRSGYICQDKVANPGPAARIEALFQKLYGPEGPRRPGRPMGPGPAWRAHTPTSKPTMRYWKFGHVIAADLWKIAPDRIPTMDFLTALTQDQARIFVETCIDGDGNRSVTKGHTYSRWTQKDERSIRAFEVACALAGIATSTHHRATEYPGGVWTVDLLTVPTFCPKAQRGRAITMQPYTGTVWCPTVEGSQTWLARRNGTVYFTGNSPNIWEAGNFDYDGQHHRFAWDLDEEAELWSIKVKGSKRVDRSSVTVAMADPYMNQPGSVKIAAFDTYTSSTKNQLHGLLAPAIIGLDKDIPQREMTTIAELTGTRMWFMRRRASIRCAGNPLIDVDDQVRTWDRTTFDTYLHRVTAYETDHDLDTGEYSMDLTTHWLGADNTNWVIRVGPNGHVVYNTLDQVGPNVPPARHSDVALPANAAIGNFDTPVWVP